MREGWSKRKIEEIATITMGQSPSGNSINETEGVEFHQGKIYFGEKYINESHFYTSEPIRIAEPNSLLLCVRAPIGVVNMTARKICIGRGLCSIKANDSIHSNFLYYALRSQKDYFNKNATGSTFLAISSNVVKDTQISFPSKDKQIQIASELDKITEMISKYDEQLKELDKLSQSIFYEMFGDPIENEKGWEVKTLKNISEKITSGNNAKLAIGTYKSEGIPYFRCQNVWKNRIDFKDMVYIDEETNQKLKSSVLKHNDLLITKIGRINTENSSLGRVSIYKGEDFQANLSGNLCFIRLLDTVNPIFVLNIMISNYFRDYIRRTTVGGTDKRALKSPQIGRFPIILPPLPLQQSFARKIEAIEAMKSKVREAKKEAETLLAARMQYWFE